MALFGHREAVPVAILYGGEWFAGAELLVKGWAGFAILGWTNYQSLGRGAVVLAATAAETADGPMYLPASKPSLLADRSTFAKRLKTDLNRYNPEKEIVMVFTGARTQRDYEKGRLEDFEAVIRPPKGLPTPPDMYWAAEEAQRNGIDLETFMASMMYRLR